MNPPWPLTLARITSLFAGGGKHARCLNAREREGTSLEEPISKLSDETSKKLAVFLGEGTAKLFLGASNARGRHTKTHASGDERTLRIRLTRACGSENRCPEKSTVPGQG